jgi:hypothetical protein
MVESTGASKLNDEDVETRPATVILTGTPAPVPAGAAQRRVVADCQLTVLQLAVLNLVDGVRFVVAKLRPVIVTEPPPHVGVFELIAKLMVGESKVKRFIPHPTRPATVVQAIAVPAVAEEYE